MMINAQGFLDSVRAHAPTDDALRRLDKGLARYLGQKPRSFLRVLERAEDCGSVSDKVACNVFGFFASHQLCERCECWFPRKGWDTRCSVCKAVPPRTAGARRPND